MDNERLEEILNQATEDWNFIKESVEKEKDIVADIKIAFFNKEIKEYLPSLNTAQNHYDEVLKELSRIIDSWSEYLAEDLDDHQKSVLQESLRQIMIIYERDSGARETVYEMKKSVNLISH